MTAPASRTMLVTVGTSIFHSASWRNEGPFERVEGYALWTEELAYLSNPERRRTMSEKGGRWTGERVTAQIEELLGDLDRMQECLKYLEVEAYQQPLRYSAELTTILALGLDEAGGHSPASFMKDRYSKVKLLVVRDESDRSHLAAFHLQRHLQRICDFDAVEICNLIVGDSINEKIRSFEKVLDKLRKDESGVPIDFVVSGGYKAYAVAVGTALHGIAPWQAYYLHAGPGENASLEVIRHKWLEREGRVRASYGPETSIQ